MYLGPERVKDVQFQTHEIVISIQVMTQPKVYIHPVSTELTIVSSSSSILGEPSGIFILKITVFHAFFPINSYKTMAIPVLSNIILKPYLFDFRHTAQRVQKAKELNNFLCFLKMFER